MAVDVAEVDDVMVATVGIKDFGEKDNEELGKRFDARKDTFPVVVLFVKDGKTKKINEFKFPASEDFKVANLKTTFRRLLAFARMSGRIRSLGRQTDVCHQPRGQG